LLAPRAGQLTCHFGDLCRRAPQQYTLQGYAVHASMTTTSFDFPERIPSKDPDTGLRFRTTHGAPP
jgi:hypothetical protein